MAETIVMNEPPRTDPSRGGPQGWQQQQEDRRPSVSNQRERQKSSKTWIWVVGILGVLMLLCGGGFVGFVFWAASQADKVGNSVVAGNRPARTPSTTETRAATSPTTNSPSNSDPSSGRDDLTTVDLDMFTKDFSVFSTTELNGDELTMGSTMKNYYYVLVAPAKDSNDEPVDDYKTNNADSSVMVRNIENADSRFGYGLVFHSNPQPLQQDYALLIDTKKKKYRVVRHQPEKELDIIKWTAAPVINGGTEENTLEARDQPDKIDLYINGTLVNSIPNTYGYPGGVIGLYSGGGVKIGFKNLQLRR